VNRNKGSSGRALPIAAGIVAVLGLAATVLDVGPARLRFFAAAAGIFFSAGLALASVLRPGDGAERRAEILALAFPAACVLLFAPLLAGELLGAGTRILAWLVRPILLAAVLFHARDAWRGEGRTRAPAPLLLLAIAAALLALGRGALVTLPSDALDHIAVIAEIRETGESFPSTSYYAEPTEIRRDARQGYLFPAAAVVGASCGAEARDVYDALPAIAALFFVISFHALAREALGPGIASVLALLYALLSFEGGILGTWFGRAGSPYLFAGPALWAGLLFVLRAPRPGKLPTIPLLFAGFALMGIHVFAAITALLLGFLYALGLLFAKGGRRDARRAFMALLLLGAGAAPIGIGRILASYPPADPIHTHLQGIVWVTEHLYAANPLLAFDRLGLFVLLAYPLSLLLAPRSREDRGVLFAVSITLLPLLVVLNPFLVPVLVPVFGYLIGRILWFGGNCLVLGRLVSDWASAVRRDRRLPVRALALVALLAAHGLFASSLWARDATEIGKRLAASPVRMSDSPGPELWADLFAYMKENLPPRAAVATDPITGYLIPACTPQKTIAILEQHGSTGDPRAPERALDMVRAMSPYVSGSETAEILRRWGAGYVLLNFRFDAPVTSFYASVDPELYASTLEKFRREPGRYRELFSRDRCHLFSFDPTGPAAAGADRPVLGPIAGPLPPGAREVREPFPNGILLEAAAAAPDTIPAGGSLDVTCYWMKERSTDDPLPYKTYLRLVRSPREKAESKWLRKVNETRTGRLERTRTMRNVLRGALPLADWPEGARFADTIRWTVPERLAEGTYDLEVTLRRSPLLRVFYVEDFFSEEDSFSGVAIATIVVRAGARRSGRGASPRGGSA